MLLIAIAYDFMPSECRWVSAPPHVLHRASYMAPLRDRCPQSLTEVPDCYQLVQAVRWIDDNWRMHPWNPSQAEQRLFLVRHRVSGAQTCLFEADITKNESIVTQPHGFWHWYPGEWSSRGLPIMRGHFWVSFKYSGYEEMPVNAFLCRNERDWQVFSEYGKRITVKFTDLTNRCPAFLLTEFYQRAYELFDTAACECSCCE